MTTMTRAAALVQKSKEQYLAGRCAEYAIEIARALKQPQECAIVASSIALADAVAHNPSETIIAAANSQADLLADYIAAVSPFCDEDSAKLKFYHFVERVLNAAITWSSTGNSYDAAAEAAAMPVPEDAHNRILAYVFGG